MKAVEIARLWPLALIVPVGGLILILFLTSVWIRAQSGRDEPGDLDEVYGDLPGPIDHNTYR